MLGQKPSTPPRCKALVGWGPLSLWISPVLVTWQLRSSQHCRPFDSVIDSVIIGSFLMTSLSLKLTLSSKWHDLVMWITRLAFSSLTPLFLSVSVIWVTWHCHMCVVRTEKMTILESFCSTTILSSSAELVIFACAQISTKWYQNAAVVDGHADVCASAVIPLTTTTMPMTVISMTLSAKYSALHPWSHFLSTLISLLALSTPTSTSLALHDVIDVY